MKIIPNILIGLTSLLLLFSCSRQVEPDYPEEQLVVVTFDADTRAPGDSDPEDRRINSLRVLGYRVSDGTLAFNEKVYGFPTSTENKTELANQRVTVKTGKFTVVFIANEHSSAANNLTTLLDGITPDNATTNTLSYFRSNAMFDFTSFDRGVNIPMVAIKQNIIIQGDNKLFDPELGSSLISTVWPVVLTRAGIRVDVTIKISPNQLDAWIDQPSTDNKKKLRFYNLPRWVSVFPGTYDTGTTKTELYAFHSAAGTETLPDDGVFKVFKRKFILPEFGSLTLAESGALTFGLPQGPLGEKKGALINLESDGTPKDWAGMYGYTIPRNHYLDVTLTIAETDVTFSIDVLSWDDIAINHELQ